MKNLKYILFILILFSGISFSVQAQIIRSQVTTWSEIINSGDLTIPNEAGTNLNSTVETSSTYNQLDIRGVKPSEQWKVTVSKQDFNWNIALIPSVKRNGIGNPCGSCSGVNLGTSVTGYLQVLDLEQDFIFGEGNVSNIDLQFKIDGITLAIDAEFYRTRIVFTLYADP